ncbi:MAG: hypothetical protein GXO43_05970 [Crenarchaeota archaeon]|nr:hypothetical protein [Thermoproteota archaeon]
MMSKDMTKMIIEDITEKMQEQDKDIVKAWMIMPFRLSPTKMVIAIKKKENKHIIYIINAMLLESIPVIIRRPQVIDEIINILQEAKQYLTREKQ